MDKVITLIEPSVGCAFATIKQRRFYLATLMSVYVHLSSIFEGFRSFHVDGGGKIRNGCRLVVRTKGGEITLYVSITDLL